MHFWDAALGYIADGGPLMWPLIALSLLLWSLVLNKSLWLASVRREPGGGEWLAGQAGEGAGPLPEAGPKSAAWCAFRSAATGNKAMDHKLWEAAVRGQGPAIWRYQAAITVLAAMAPLLGLLGTVGGMIETFQVIQAQGTGNAQALAAGIRQSLITTQTGLLIAIPGLAAGEALRREARRLQQRLWKFQGEVDRWLDRREAETC